MNCPCTMVFGRILCPDHVPSLCLSKWTDGSSIRRRRTTDTAEPAEGELAGLWRGFLVHSMTSVAGASRRRLVLLTLRLSRPSPRGRIPRRFQRFMRALAAYFTTASLLRRTSTRCYGASTSGRSPARGWGGDSSAETLAACKTLASCPGPSSAPVAGQEHTLGPAGSPDRTQRRLAARATKRHRCDAADAPRNSSSMGPRRGAGSRSPQEVDSGARA